MLRHLVQPTNQGSHRRKALSTSDRNLEILNRVMVTALNTLDSLADAVVASKVCI